jgi:signal transduction histidine kinase
VRRRLFWAIVGVASITGLLVLVGSVIASQRAAVEATYREMKQSSDEAVLIIQDAVDRAEHRPGAAAELFRLVEGDLGPLLARIRRTSGGSEIAFGIITPEGEFRSNAPLFDRITPNEVVLREGRSQFTKSFSDELVVVTPTQVPVRAGEITILVALAREAPVVRLADQGLGLLLVVVGVGLLAAFAARLQANKVAARLEPLAVASRELADGDMTARVPNLGDPELDEVAGAFNEMASDLEATKKRERDFILGVGHDLRTPLTTIGGYAEALEAGEVDPDDLGRIGAVLGAQTRQLGRLIEDLAMLARMEQPEFSLRMELVDVGAHIGEIVEGFERRAGEVGVNLELAASDNVMVETDPDRLGQIAQNLLENALRFTPETGTVSVSVEQVESLAVLTVSDTGPGIASEDLPFVFDRHFVGARRQVRNEGTGLGLSIVEGLVGRLGGEVVAESTEGRGTTIRVTLPV